MHFVSLAYPNLFSFGISNTTSIGFSAIFSATNFAISAIVICDFIHHIISPHIFAFNQNGQQCPLLHPPYSNNFLRIFLLYEVQYHCPSWHFLQTVQNTVFPGNTPAPNVCASLAIFTELHALRSIGNAHILHIRLLSG